jgi:hypothetical protein
MGNRSIQGYGEPLGYLDLIHKFREFHVCLFARSPVPLAHSSFAFCHNSFEISVQSLVPIASIYRTAMCSLSSFAVQLLTSASCDGFLERGLRADAIGGRSRKEVTVDNNAGYFSRLPPLTYERRYEIVDFAPERRETGVFAPLLYFA